MARLPPLAALLTLVACATTVADPRLSTPPADGADPQIFWTNLTASYRGPMSAQGADEMLQAGIAMGGDVCDPHLLDTTKVCSRLEGAGDVHEVHCRMRCRARVPKPGPTLASATLFVAGRPVALQLDRVELAGKP